MNKPIGKRIAVFFTHGVSLELWDKRGIFSREVNFFRRLAERTGEVWFFTYGKDDKRYAEKLGAHIRLFEKRMRAPNLVYAFILPFIYWRQLRQADILRTHQMAGAIPALIAHWFLRKPLVARSGYQWLRLLSQENAGFIKRAVVFLIERFAYNAAASIILTASQAAEDVARRHHVSPQKIKVIPNYVNTELFRPMDVVKEQGLVCFVGRISKEKNLLNLVQAMKGVDARLLLIGDGPQKEAVFSLARENGVELNHYQRIPNDKLPDLLNVCEIFILPSFSEGSPKALLEAMSCGLPVVGTRVRGIETIIEHDKNGILCDTDADSIREAIQGFLGDRERQFRLGRAARNTILRTYSLDGVVDAELQLFQTL